MAETVGWEGEHCQQQPPLFLPIPLPAHLVRPRVGVVDGAVERLRPKPGRAGWLNRRMRPHRPRRPPPAPTVKMPAFQCLGSIAEGPYSFRRVQQSSIVSICPTEMLAPQLE